MKNKFRIEGAEAFISLNYKGQTIETVIDIEDIPKIDAVPWTWGARKHRSTFYATTREYPSKQNIHMHNLICPPNPVTDHIDGNGLDNRKVNLRSTTHSGNSHNTKRKKLPSSGVRCVYPHYGKWRVIICLHRKLHHLGSYKTVEEAQNVVLQFKKNNLLIWR